MAETEHSREKRRARERAWAAAHPERIREHRRNWYARNRETVAANKRAWRIANPEKAKEASRKNHAQQKENRQLHAFKHQQSSAKRRNIPFLLTYTEWWAVWQASGKWEQRGLGSDQYCMARCGDIGAYEVGNVRICTGRENRAEARKGKPLSEAHRKALVEAWKKRGPVSDAQRAALVKAWERRRQRLPPLRIRSRVLPKAQG